MKQNMTTRREFEAQALPHVERLYRTASYVSDNESDAHDLVQESLARGYHAWLKSQVSPDSRVWLFRAMANALADRPRPSFGRSAVTDSTERIDGFLVHFRLMNVQPVDDSGQVPLSSISKDDVKRAIGNLHDNFKLIVVLSLLEGFSYQEITDITGIPLEAVRSRLHLGRKLMQRELFDHLVSEGNYKMTASRVRSTRMG